MSEDYQPHVILLTGGAGFIGSHVCNHLVLKYPDVKIICLDVMDYCANLRNLEEIMNKPNFLFIKGSINNVELVSYIMKTHAVDTVMHFAAQSHVDRSFGNSLEFTHTNILGTHVLLECAKQNNIKRFIHVSTDEVYGEVLSGCAEEEKSILCPTNPYACSKAGAEFMCQAYIRSFNMPIIITRGNNVFGPKQFPEKVIPKFTLLLKAGHKCCIHGDGSALRNFLHTSDVVQAFDTILHKGKLHQIYNIGTDFEISVLEMTKKLIKVLNMPGKPEDWIEFVPDRAFNDSRYMINSSKLIALGWHANTDFDTLLKETVQWYLDHMDYWKDRDINTYLSPHPIAYAPKTAE
ncbi:NAD dependent epimerase/dehydratase family protein [Trichomonas vaginalis G3]|uniref:NAD dependent epimerase/dehydratase family protein n=1 Tax=Trichomonas vaginalis (strain ATCC PRA-98 / G3) TaxID=412133 RepID=A2GEF2_TRIV3|nr:dTDP-D-glucose 4,6-dehydratase-related family [Trichomonas vaginalis G3]EAX84465.1 NAD dependent epimerase/dehydratase family protein [Trichomonas vaginalis G3]KAI5486056.1 dTDP-D-glucose 4,6-dehydratase-related family [Trichomonas vaginalis G3]|eukprot:XP_001297395.1 NAD dependent epimerase/dehydratase family protein [Trichomonas vaginalis G3]